MIRVVQVSNGSQPSSAQIGDAEEKSGDKCLPVTDLFRTLMGCPSLEADHFLFEAEKNDQGDHKRQADNKKGQDDHHWAVGQFKGRMNIVDDGDEQHQDQAEADDAFIDGGKIEQKTFHDKGKGNKQGNIEKYAEKDILLGFLNLDIDPGRQSQGLFGAGAGDRIDQSPAKLSVLAARAARPLSFRSLMRVS